MDATRRLWAIASLAVGLAGFALLTARPLALAGSVLLGAWLISRQFLFYRATTRLAEDISVTHSPAKTGVRTAERIPTTLSAALGTPSRLALSVDGGVPTTATVSEPLALTVNPGETNAATTVDVRWPVAGQHTFDTATLTVTDGLFRQELPVGSTPTVTVEPRVPRNLHVGEGGDRIATAYGEHDAGRLGSGIEPAELREYVPGDTADRIDWNATARLGTPYVREFDAETDRKTMLVVDHSQSLSTGQVGETKLEYVRELALAMAENARQLGDPLGMLTVGDEGVTERVPPATQPDQYATVRRTLHSLSPTSGPQESTGDSLGSTTTLAGVNRALATLDGEESQFARTLQPFYADRQVYVDRISADPLYTAVQSLLAREQGTVFTVLCTDDSAPAELLETAKLASSDGGTILVLLAPTVLYEQDGLADVERAYDRYVEFEELRRELATIGGVTALEVGPGDRLSTVLAAGQNQRAQVGGEPS